MTRHLAVALVLLSFAAACNSPSVWVEAKEEIALPSASVRSLQCSTANGHVDVHGIRDRAAAVQVVVSKRGGAQTEEDAQQALAAIEVTHDESGGTLRLGWRWSTERRSDWHAAVGFTVTMPSDRQLAVETSNGAVTLADLEAGAKVSSSNGKITIARCAGDWDATTSNGAIEASGAPSRLELRTSNGSVHTDLSTKGPIDGKIRTSNGAIHLALADSASTRVKAETSNGSVSVGASWKVVERKKRSVDATWNGGNGVLMVDTSNGAIELR